MRGNQIIARGRARAAAVWQRLTKFGPTVGRFPPQVWIENTNSCNAHCVMCPREALTRKQMFMDFALFEKIMAEIARHKGAVKKVNLHNFGEPLLDRRLPKTAAPFRPTRLRWSTRLPGMRPKPKLLRKFLCTLGPGIGL